MNPQLERAVELKQALVDFVYDAEGELAVALESYAAQQGNKERYGIKQQNLILDTFITAGKVGEQTPIELFLAQATNLTDGDRDLLHNWQNSFTGLFEIKQILPDCLELMNWLTAKHYRVFLPPNLPANEKSRWQVGEILLTRIAPLDEQNWMLFSDFITKGKLSKPKLAVAIGEFKRNYPDSLYGDAPDLLEQAWESVVIYHQEFVDFFGSDRLTLPGYKLNQQLGELQAKMSERRLAEAGIDSSKSVQDLIRETGADREEIEEAAVAVGAEAEAVDKMLKSKEKLSLVTSKIELPPEIKQAEQVTVFSHPRWGQMYLPTYTKLTTLLASAAPEENQTCQLLVRKYLEDPQINYYIWQQLQQEYAPQLEKVLQTTLNLPDYNLEEDLPETLKKYEKCLEPTLPEIASVPQHLHDLFTEAVAQVQKSKTKKKKKTSKGFQ
jgi:hypothetical protein